MKIVTRWLTFLTHCVYAPIISKEHLILYRVPIWLHIPFHDTCRLLQGAQWESKLDRCRTGMSITGRTSSSTRHQRRNWTICRCCNAWRHWPSVSITIFTTLQHNIAIHSAVIAFTLTQRPSKPRKLTSSNRPGWAESVQGCIHSSKFQADFWCTECSWRHSHGL